MKSLLLSSFLAAAVLAGSAARAATPVFGQTIPLASYSIDAGSEFATGAAADGLLAGVPGSGTSLADLEAGVSLPGSLYLAPTVDSPTVAASRTNGQFFEFTLSSAAGYLLQPEQLSFLTGKGGADGLRGWAVYSSADFFTTPIATADVTATQPGLENVTVPLTGFAPSEAVTFRIYGYSPAAGQGLFFDNLSVSGVVLIPEPSAVLMSGLSCVLMALRRRRA